MQQERRHTTDDNIHAPAASVRAQGATVITAHVLAGTEATGLQGR